MRRLLCAVLLAACGSSSDSPDARAVDAPAGHHDGPGGDAPGAATGQWVLGYYVGYDLDSYPIADLDFTGLTHIAFAPLTVNGDRTLNLSFDSSSGVSNAQLLVSRAHAHGVQVLAMLGGAGNGPQIAAAADAAHRPQLVADLVASLDTLGGFDGIDLDWEDSVDLDDLVSLAQDLRAARPDIVLSYPAGSINGNYQTVDPRFADLAQALDRFMVQTYYPSTAFAGSGWDSWFVSPLSGVSPSTPIAADDTLARYAAVGIPAAKLGLGMSFYAICYTGGISGPRQPTSASTRIVGGDNNYALAALFSPGSTLDLSAPSEQLRDSVAASPYLSLSSPVNDPHCGASTRYISYDDELSIAAKGAFSRSHGYGGLIIWTINQGLLPANAIGGRTRLSLFTALQHAFLDP